MEGYYRRRAQSFEEEVYNVEDIVRKKELQSIAQVSKKILKRKDVFDVACGTGYWTKTVSETARSIVGVDYAREMLEIAKQKHFKCPVSLCKVDAFHLPFNDAVFSGGMADFWFSHIPREKIDFFLQNFHSLMKRGSSIVITDNVYVPGLGGKLVRKGCDPNSYKVRKLMDGSEHLILKNYFSTEELIEIFAKQVKAFNERNLFFGKYYWYLFYELK